jgi:DNA-binding LytR/AlgR family response regulator
MIALDDQPPALQIVSHFCERIDFADLQMTFSKTSEAMSYLQNNPVDLIILDINMPAISGIDFYKSLPHKIMAIFTTAYSEYAVEGFSLSAIDYLLKPFTFERFLQAMNKAREYQSYARLAASNAPQDLSEPPNASSTQHILLRADYGHVRITLSDILFIEGLDNYLRIHLQERDPIIIRITMKALLEKLPPRDFIRVHRSYIVPLGRVANVRNKTVTVAGRDIPLGASYEADFYKAFGN